MDGASEPTSKMNSSSIKLLFIRDLVSGTQKLYEDHFL